MDFKTPPQIIWGGVLYVGKETSVCKEKTLDTFFALCYPTLGDEHGVEIRTRVSL